MIDGGSVMQLSSSATGLAHLNDPDICLRSHFVFHRLLVGFDLNLLRFLLNLEWSGDGENTVPEGRVCRFGFDRLLVRAAST
jgi:hypothetical protein